MHSRITVTEKKDSPTHLHRQLRWNILLHRLKHLLQKGKHKLKLAPTTTTHPKTIERQVSFKTYNKLPPNLNPLFQSHLRPLLLRFTHLIHDPVQLLYFWIRSLYYRSLRMWCNCRLDLGRHVSSLQWKRVRFTLLLCVCA